MPLRKWLMLKIVSQCEEELKTLNNAGPQTDAATWDWKECKGREWRGKHIHGPRDNYGIMGT
jgi:hypothetical protein